MRDSNRDVTISHLVSPANVLHILLQSCTEEKKKNKTIQAVAESANLFSSIQVIIQDKH